MSTLTLILLIPICALASALLVDWASRRARRRDREIVRRIVRYLDSLPPARPW